MKFLSGPVAVVNFEGASAKILIEIFSRGTFSNDFTQMILVSLFFQASAEFVVQDVGVQSASAIHEFWVEK